MKPSVLHGPMQNNSNNSPSRSTGSALESALQQLRKDSRWRIFVVGAFVLFGVTYAAVLVVSAYDCSVEAVAGDSNSAFCKLAALSNSVAATSRSDIRKPANESNASDNRPAVARGGAKGTTTALDRIVFGIAGNADLWGQRKEFIKLWWKPGVTRGFVWVDRNLDKWEAGDPPFRISEDTSRFGYTHPTQLRSALRIARIVGESYRLNLADVDWYVMGDDDTVFFTENLVRVLSKYDPRKLYYVGYNSEDSRQTQRHLWTLAFGGGGIAISSALARALAEIQDECLERYTGLYGSDERLKACVDELGVPLTKESGFHQLDIRGDISGFLAAHPVSPLVTLHHVDAVAPIFYNMTTLEAVRKLLVAARVSSEALLQQSICYAEGERWSFAVAWGYVVEVYEGFVSPRVLELPATTFISWAWKRENTAFTMDTRALAEECGRPARFFMVDARVSGKGRDKVGVSSYGKLTEFEDRHCKAKAAPLDTVKTIRVENKPMAEDWLQNPRRQCCRVKKMESQSIDIEVAPCRDAENLVSGRKQTRR